MLIKENKTNVNILDQLNEAVYLTQEEASLNCSAVPVIATESGDYKVDYCYLNSIAEENNIPFMQAVSVVAESNDIDASKLLVVMDESEVYTNNEDIPNFVVRPVNEDSLIYSIMEDACIGFLNEEMTEEEFIDLCLSEEVTPEQMKKMQEMRDKHIKRAVQKNADEKYESNKNFYAGNISAADSNKRIQDSDAKKTKKLGDIDAATNRLYNMQLNKSKREEARKEANKEEGKRRVQSLLARHAENKAKEQSAPQMEIKDEPSNAQSSKPDSQGEVKNLPAKAETKPEENKSILQKHPKAIGLAAGIAGSALVTAAYNHYANKPKSMIGKKIAALRSIYSKFMKRAQASKDSGVAAKLKKVAAKILSIIDKLMGYLQNKAG